MPTLASDMQRAIERASANFRVPDSLKATVGACDAPLEPWGLAKRLVLTAVDPAATAAPAAAEATAAASETPRATAQRLLLRTVDEVREACRDGKVDAGEALDVVTLVAQLVQSLLRLPGGPAAPLLDEYNPQMCCVTLFYGAVLILHLAGVDSERIASHEETLVKVAHVAGSMLASSVVLESTAEAVHAATRRCCA